MELKCILKKGISKKSGAEYFYYEIYLTNGYVKKIFVNPFTEGAESALIRTILK